MRFLGYLIFNFSNKTFFEENVNHWLHIWFQLFSKTLKTYEKIFLFLKSHFLLEISLFKHSIDSIFINSYLTNAITILLVTSILLGTSSHFFSITDLIFPIFLHLLNKTYKIHFPPKKINSKSSFQFFIVFSLLLHNLHTIHPFFYNIDCLLIHYIYLSPDNCYFTIFLEIFTSFVIIFFSK